MIAFTLAQPYSALIVFQLIVFISLTKNVNPKITMQITSGAILRLALQISGKVW
jgi:hypothetical protein